jgi:hypothetical protein
MQAAQQVEVSWDSQKSQWLVRIQIGEEVIRRHTGASKNADERELRELASKMTHDEGYEIEPSAVTIKPKPS